MTTTLSEAELRALAGDDPFVRGSLRKGRRIAAGWSGYGALGWLGIEADGRLGYLSVLGPPDGAARLVAEAVAAVEASDPAPEAVEAHYPAPAAIRVTIPRGAAAYLPGRLELTDPTDWDFRWTQVAPPQQPGEEQAGWAVDDASVATLLAAEHPDSSTQVGDSGVRRWAAIATDASGAVLAGIAADTSGVGGVGHMSGVTVRAHLRGRGYGRALCAWLTRQLLADHDTVTLGVYSHNAAARHLYDRLGYRGEHQCTSGRLVRR